MFTEEAWPLVLLHVYNYACISKRVELLDIKKLLWSQGGSGFPFPIPIGRFM